MLSAFKFGFRVWGLGKLGGGLVLLDPDHLRTGFGLGAHTAHELTTHRLHSSSFWGLPYTILYMNPKKELLWSL